MSCDLFNGRPQRFKTDDGSNHKFHYGSASRCHVVSKILTNVGRLHAHIINPTGHEIASAKEILGGRIFEDFEASAEVSESTTPSHAQLFVLVVDRLATIKDSLQDLRSCEHTISTQPLHLGDRHVHAFSNCLQQQRRVFCQRLQFIALQLAGTNRLAKLKHCCRGFLSRCTRQLEGLARDFHHTKGVSRVNSNLFLIQRNTLIQRCCGLQIGTGLHCGVFDTLKSPVEFSRRVGHTLDFVLKIGELVGHGCESFERPGNSQGSSDPSTKLRKRRCRLIDRALDAVERILKIAQIPLCVTRV